MALATVKQALAAFTARLSTFVLVADPLEYLYESGSVQQCGPNAQHVGLAEKLAFKASPKLRAALVIVGRKIKRDLSLEGGLHKANHWLGLTVLHLFKSHENGLDTTFGSTSNHPVALIDIADGLDNHLDAESLQIEDTPAASFLISSTVGDLGPLGQADEDLHGIRQELSIYLGHQTKRVDNINSLYIGNLRTT
ncbi:MAG: hypothetical protein AAF471_07195 [Myxococcota bacterium]